MSRPWICLAVLATLSPGLPSGADAPPHPVGPWDLAALKTPPKATWGRDAGLVREVFYEGEPLGGKPTRVFGYYARPKSGNGPFPAMVLVHGGGGKAFAEWATLWAERGYAALAMDLAGHGPDGARLADGGPDQDDGTKFRPFGPDEVKEMWTYHAVAAVIRGHSLLAAQPEVDKTRVGITGISWGGYLTCIVAGIDDRLKCAAPVYGCGFLQEDSVWVPIFRKMDEAQRARWVSHFDPSAYLPGVSCPILFVNGTNDFAYPLDSYRKSYELVKSPKTLCVTVNMPHGHAEGWAPKEIGIFVDSVLRGGKPLPKLGGAALLQDGSVLFAKTSYQAEVPLAKAALHFTEDEGPWQQRKWTSVDLPIKQPMQEGYVGGFFPTNSRPRVAFLTVTDERGATVSTHHFDTNGKR